MVEGRDIGILLLLLLCLIAGGVWCHNFVYGTVLLFPIDVEYNESLNNLTLEEFHIHTIRTFEYNEYKDCKYWTKYWATYFKANEYDVTYIPVEKHIFLTAQKDGVNYIADQTSLK